MNRIAMLMLPLTLAGCTSSDVKTGHVDVSQMIFVPPVDVYETTHCIALQQVRSTRVIDRVGIAYEMPDRKIWLNRPQWGASLLQDDLVMVSQTTSNMLCSGDIVRFVDSSPAGIRASVALGPFISYSTAP
ncbi:hypothetical protein [Sphingorhabdus sp. Alg231-15]|uniref:hypothetical protein n=1 Tax=Sphingorhabdus sp. Alg231-15 TaxID=1922222 RepID=UPI00307BB075